MTHQEEGGEAKSGHVSSSDEARSLFRPIANASFHHLRHSILSSNHHNAASSSEMRTSIRVQGGFESSTHSPIVKNDMVGHEMIHTSINPFTPTHSSTGASHYTRFINSTNLVKTATLNASKSEDMDKSGCDTNGHETRRLPIRQCNVSRYLFVPKIYIHFY